MTKRNFTSGTRELTGHVRVYFTCGEFYLLNKVHINMIDLIILFSF